MIAIEPARRRHAALIAVAAALGLVSHFVAERQLAGRVGPALDDGWIYLAFARSLAEGEWFAYPGHEGPVAAITGPLWSFVLAIAMAIAGADAAVARGCGLLAYALVLFGTHRLARAAGGDRALAAWATAIVAVTARTLWSSLSGMEGGLGTGLSLLGLALHLEHRGSSGRAWLRAALVLGLAGWARPENFVFLGVAALHRRRIGAVAVAAAIVATFPAFHLLVYGVPAPLPLFAKSSGDAPWNVAQREGGLAGLQALFESLAVQVAAVLGLLAAFAPPLVLGFAAGLRRARRERSGVGLLALAIAAFALARGALGAQPPAFQHARYFAQLWPLFAICCLTGFRFEKRAGERRLSWLDIAVLAVLALGFALEPRLVAYQTLDYVGTDFPFTPQQLHRVLFWAPLLFAAGFALLGALAARRDPEGRLRFARAPLVLWLGISLGFGAYHFGEGVRDTYDVNVRMAEQVRRHTSPGELVACHDIGALGWFAERPLLDLAGLASPEVTFRPRLPDGQRDFVGVLVERRPRWLCVTDVMIGIVNPLGARLPELRGLREIEAARVESAINVTVAGDRYFLIELDWAR